MLLFSRLGTSFLLSFCTVPNEMNFMNPYMHNPWLNRMLASWPPYQAGFPGVRYQVGHVLSTSSGKDLLSRSLQVVPGHRRLRTFGLTHSPPMVRRLPAYMPSANPIMSAGVAAPALLQQPIPPQYLMGNMYPMLSQRPYFPRVRM